MLPNILTSTSSVDRLKNVVVSPVLNGARPIALQLDDRTELGRDR